jgi:hypothetical protein
VYTSSVDDHAKAGLYRLEVGCAPDTGKRFWLDSRLLSAHTPYPSALLEQSVHTVTPLTPSKSDAPKFAGSSSSPQSEKSTVLPPDTWQPHPAGGQVVASHRAALASLPSPDRPASSQTV